MSQTEELPEVPHRIPQHKAFGLFLSCDRTGQATPHQLYWQGLIAEWGTEDNVLACLERVPEDLSGFPTMGIIDRRPNKIIELPFGVQAHFVHHVVNEIGQFAVEMTMWKGRVAGLSPNYAILRGAAPLHGMAMLEEIGMFYGIYCVSVGNVFRLRCGNQISPPFIVPGRD